MLYINIWERKINRIQSFLLFENELNITKEQFIQIFKDILKEYNEIALEYDLYCSNEQDFLLFIDAIIKKYRDILLYEKGAFNLDERNLKKILKNVLKKFKDFTIYEWGRLILILKENKNIDLDTAISQINSIEIFENINDIIIYLESEKNISDNYIKSSLPNKCKDNYDNCSLNDLKKLIKTVGININQCGRFYCGKEK